MIPVIISASAYKHNKNACLQHVQYLINEFPNYQDTIFIDLNSLKSFQYNCTTVVTVSQIKVDDLVNETSLQSRKIALRAFADQLTSTNIVLLDARFYELNIISSLLHDIARIWFQLTEWQPAFVLVVDDYYCLQFIRELNASFYIQPLSTSKRYLAIEMKRMLFQAFLYRWFGFSLVSRSLRLLSIRFDKVCQYVRKYFT